MKKLFKFFPAVVAMMAFSACQNDQFVEEPVTTPEPETFEGDAAYMKINISDVNSFGAKASAGGFEHGTLEEHKVTDASFFFFDDNGVFVLEGHVANPSFGTTGTTENIEYVGQNNILVLEDLTGKNWPKYLITVLNDPDFTPESTIELTAKKLDNYQNETGNMIMSTSSFSKTGDKNHSDKYPYATMLDETDFYLSAADATKNNNAVKIYVERLAAKVELNVDAALTNDETKVIKISGRTLYKLTETLAGTDNDQGGATAATTDLYIEILGWDLNATTNKSYMSKQLKMKEDGTLAWSGNDPFTGWNDSDNYRSYWAMSPVYNTTAMDVDLITDPNTVGLQYTTFNAKKLALGAYTYCNENTNTVDKIFKNDSEGRPGVLPAQTTHVVLKTLVCDKTGKPLDLVSYHGVLYKEDSYINYVLNNIMRGNKENLNFYTLNSETKEYNQVDSKFFTLKKDGSAVGQIKIIVKDTDVPLFAKQADGTWGDANVADLTTKLDAAQPAANSKYPAISYKGGNNVYYIPVEHFAAKGTNNSINVEGYFGVVRNHWYRLTISSFSRVGHGVFDPDHEKLIPEGPEDPLYYLGVNINILSWKIVNQSVDL